MTIKEIKVLIGEEGIYQCYKYQKDLNEKEEILDLIDKWETSTGKQFPIKFDDKDFSELIQRIWLTHSNTEDELSNEIRKQCIENFVKTKNLEFNF